MSIKAKEQWADPAMRTKMLKAIRSAGLSRRCTFDRLTENSFNRHKADGRVYAMYWEEGDKKRYIHRYQWLWIKENGPIPEGMVLHHKNGDCSDDRIANLGIMTQADHIKLHPKPNNRQSYECQTCQTVFMRSPRKERPNKYCSLGCYHLALRSMTSQ
jgi:hypothetical protein